MTEEQEKEKICKQCSQSFPLSHFASYPKAYDGKRSICKECSSKAISEGINKKKQKQKLVKEYAIKITFEDYPKIYEKLCKIAETELRTPENQALYILRGILENSCY